MSLCLHKKEAIHFSWLLYVLYTQSLQLRLILCDSMDCSPPGSSVHGILQATILEWVAMSSSRGSSPPRNQTHISCVSCTGKQILYHCVTREAWLLYSYILFYHGNYGLASFLCFEEMCRILI